MRLLHVRRSWLAALSAVAAPVLLSAQIPTARVDSTLIAGLRWRNVGPANMGGRVVDVQGIPAPSRTFFVSTATGGVWKTTNAGTTFRLVFGGNGDEGVISGGAMAIAPSDTNQVWFGTGEPNIRNSVSPGGGIFKSTDGGITWKKMGLDRTETIARIVVHPTNPNLVYVAASGAIWRTNPERGLYRTTNGGESWELIKFISDRAGFIDVVMDPSNPEVLYAASWERIRGPYFLQSGGPGSARWKTTDGGKTWTEIKGGGFPETMKGRIGLAISRSNPQVLYAMVEADTAPNPRPQAGARAQTRPSGLYRTEDGGRTWTRTAPQNVRPFYYSQVHVDPTDPSRVYFSSTPRVFSTDGGKTVRPGTQGIHVDTHALWIDPNDPAHLIEGNDGGVYQSWDKGGNWMNHNIIPIGQPYNVSFDMGVPYRICGGFQDNGSWCGPSRRRGLIGNNHWYNIGGGDGFHTASNLEDANIVYGESQGGNMYRLNLATGERTQLARPQWRPAYLKWQDSILAVRGDTTKPATREQTALIAELRRRATQDSLDLQLRWNWNTPFFLSPHNQGVFYAAANRVMKSLKGGDEMFPISPELSNADTMKIRVSTRTTGGITPDVTGAETYGTIVSLAESPIRPGLLIAGTDDGNVWITRNDGGSWEKLNGRWSGVPPFTFVSRVVASSASPGAAWVTYDGHRSGHFEPYAFRTTDFGRTWTKRTTGLPSGDVVRTIHEYPGQPGVAFIGTERALYVTIDTGATWTKFRANLPTVPTYDILVHPRTKDLILGTHGRSIWILDDASPIASWSPAVAAKAAHLFPTRPVAQYLFWEDFSNWAQGEYAGANPPDGALISYALSRPVPSATITMPACCENPMPTPPPWWSETQVAPVAVLSNAFRSGQSETASVPSFIASVSRFGLATEPESR